MAKNTTRDAIWTAALIKLSHDKPLRAGDIAEDVGCNERTARDTLKTMSRTPFVRQRWQDGDTQYLPGEPLEENSLDVPAEDNI